MARKKCVDETAVEKKTKKKSEKKHSEFPEYVKVDIRHKIEDNFNLIKNIVSEYLGIGEMPDKEWYDICDIVISMQGVIDDWKHKISVPVKRKKYNLTDRVREMDRKRFILAWCERYENSHSENDDNGMIYAAYLMYLHMEIMIKEGMIEKKEVEHQKEK